MLFKTHIAFALLISLYFFHYFTTPPILSILIILFASLIPDLDTINSKISKINPLRKLTKYIFKHRGMLHSLFTPILIYLIIYIIHKEIALLIAIGYTSHLFLDSFTKQGIKPFYPLTNLKFKGNTTTNSIIEKLLFWIIAILILLKFFTPHWTFVRKLFK